MFAHDTMIDSIQNGKKEFVKMTVKNENIAQALNKFVDAQTEYTKAAFKTGIDTTKTIGSEFVSALTTVPKFDYESMFKNASSAFQSMMPKSK